MRHGHPSLLDFHGARANSAPERKALTEREIRGVVIHKTASIHPTACIDEPVEIALVPASGTSATCSRARASAAIASSART